MCVYMHWYGMWKVFNNSSQGHGVYWNEFGCGINILFFYDVFISS